MVYEKKNDAATAGGLFEQAAEHWRVLAEQFPLYVEFKRNLEWVEEKLAGK